MNSIDTYIGNGNYIEAIKESDKSETNNLSKLLKLIHEQVPTKETENSISIPIDVPENLISVLTLQKDIRIKMMCNWMTTPDLREYYNKFSKGNYRWDNIVMVLDDPDYFVIINSPMGDDKYIPEKTIVFQMEPNMKNNTKIWGDWASPDKTKFLKVFDHSEDYNNNEWHLNASYSKLSEMTIKKHDEYDNILSTVLSAKYRDPGHVKRIDFVKFLEKKDFPVHVYGNNKWDYKQYMGSLPVYQKDFALFPYKYSFNCENNSIKNYYTEKLIDSILSESLCFYSGCYNIREYIDEKAYVYLDLNDFEKDYQKVKEAIEGNLWEERIEIIRKEKKKILNHLNFFPRIKRFFEELNIKKENN